MNLLTKLPGGAALLAAVLTLLMLPPAALAQINLASGVQTYTSLTGTTVNLSNRCELRVTDATTPITGCLINLTSPDTSIVLSGIKPSVVVSTYLSQLRVNGAAAVVDGNCRVVEYAMGAIVLPHAPSFQPLQVFNAPYFNGSSTNLNQWTLHDTAAELGPFYRTIGSFKLKRGYIAVFAEFPDGTGISQSYVAQDGDLEVAVMPTGLEQAMFVRVMPWRWTSKKSIAGDPGNSLLNLQSWYNWDVGASSTRDIEYVGIKQKTDWPSLNQDWQSKQVNTVLGFNEPDQANQANMTVDAAINQWPELLGTGLRIGSPATSDGGYPSWLYPFTEQADAAKLRVDFVAVHYYRCTTPTDAAGAATQMYNALKGIYDQTKRPIWITEWNNGANWTSCSDPTYAQQQAAISAMITMLDNTPFVERYALYNWVEDVRAVVTNGVLTPAGVTYRDKQSPVGHQQSFPDNSTRSFAQLHLDSDTLDSSGCGNNGVTTGCPAYTNGFNGQALVFDGTNTVVTLPVNVARSNAFTFAAWINWGGGAIWQRIFDFGNSTTHYMFLSPSASGSNLRFAIANGGAEQQVNAPVLPQNAWVHVAVTLSGSTARIYTNGVLAAQNAAMSISPASFAPRVNYLGRSQFAADPMFKGLMDEVLITDSALSAARIAALMTNTPPAFTNVILSGGSATQGAAYVGSIAGSATDANPGDTITYSKASGPAWLTVAANGALTGTPTFDDSGTNEFTVMATDSAGAAAFAVLTIALPGVLGDGTWSVASSGVWSDASKWSGSFSANGASYTADFSTLSAATTITVTLDSARTIGELKFGYTSGAQSWTLTNNGTSVLTLDAALSSIAVPVTVNSSSTAALALPLVNPGGIRKIGTGTLVLSSSNSLGRTLYVDTGSTSTAEGPVRAAHPNALSGLADISIRNNSGTGASSTLQFDGTRGSVSSSAALALNGRNSTVPAVQNLSGTNTLSGTTTINVGGSFYTFQSDVGILNLGDFTSIATGARTLTFQGNAHHVVAGAIDNGAATTLNVTKSGIGTLTLSGDNSYAGTTTINGGTVQVGNGGGTGKLGQGNTVNNAALIFNRSNSFSYSFNISGNGSLAKQGAGILTLAGSSSYFGVTAVNAGTLNLGAPLLHLSFDNVSGATVTNDGAGGAALNGAIIGTGATIATGGRYGNGLSIGTGAVNAGYVRVNDAVANFDIANSWTWGMWIKTTTAGAAYLYQGSGSWVAGNSSFYLNSGSTTGTKGGGVRWGQGWQAGTAALNDGNWHHIAMTCSAGTKTFYVDGAVDAWTTNTWNGSGTGNQLWIGGTADTGDGNVRFNGMIDEVVVYDRALSQPELVNLISGVTSTTAAISPSSVPTIAAGATLFLGGNHARLNGISGAGVVDSGLQYGFTNTPVLTISNSGSATFAGPIKNSNGKLSLVKSGNGTQTLSGTNSYTGNTTVSAGTLLINGSLATNTVNVTGGVLGGNGTIGGATAIQSGATLSPGGSTGTLTFGSSLTLAAGANTLMEISAAGSSSDLVRVTNSLTYGGTLTVNNLAGTPTAGQSFQLFAAGSFAGAFSNTNLPALTSGIAWQWTPGNGTLSVITTVAQNPTNLVASWGAGTLQLSWPDDHIGWRLEAQTNALTDTNWFTVPGSAVTNQITVFPDTAISNAFYRLAYP